MDDLQIELKNAALSLKQVYYTDGKQSILTYKPTRRLSGISLLLILATGVFFLLTFSGKVELVVIFFMLFLITTLMLFSLGKQALAYFKWKKRVDAFIRSTAQYKKTTLYLRPATMELTRDNDTIVEKWENFKKVELKDNFIILISQDESYVFPALSMEPSEYDQLKAILHQKLNQVEIA